MSSKVLFPILSLFLILLVYCRSTLDPFFLLWTFVFLGGTIGFHFFSIHSTQKPQYQFFPALNQSSEKLLKSSDELLRTSQSLATEAAEQATSLEEISSFLEEITSMTKQNAKNAQSAKELADDTRKTAEVGVQKMKKMSLAITEIKKATDDIYEIIKFIDSIAFQTNMLALNATVEAARAGDAGRGFAVVADEVSNLAQRSAQFAKKLRKKLKNPF
jgi:methyl-accepting chemotaxis protein